MDLQTQIATEAPTGLRWAELTPEHIATIRRWQRAFPETPPVARTRWTGKVWVAQVWCWWLGRVDVGEALTRTAALTVARIAATRAMVWRAYERLAELNG